MISCDIFFPSIIIYVLRLRVYMSCSLKNRDQGKTFFCWIIAIFSTSSFFFFIRDEHVHSQLFFSPHTHSRFFILVWKFFFRFFFLFSSLPSKRRHIFSIFSEIKTTIWERNMIKFLLNLPPHSLIMTFFNVILG